MKSLSMVKRLAVAAVAAAALIGPVTSAHALQFNEGDVVLTVYGNATEYAANIGTVSNMLTNGVNIDLSSVIGALQGTPFNPLRYTVVSYTGGSFLFGDRDPRTSWTAQQVNQISAPTFISGLNGWDNALGLAADARTLFPVNDPLSFTSNMNIAGNETFGAISPLHPGATSVESVLNLLQRNAGAANLSQVGTAILSLQGPNANRFVVSAVPLPAAVVLFATGVIGLVGLARRRMSGVRPDAA